MQRVYDSAALSAQTVRARRSQGFTLVELMITVAVAAILLGIATPSFTSILNSNRLTSAANEMVATLQIARMEAVRRNRRVKVCNSADGESCIGAGSWIVLDADDNVLRVGTFNPKIMTSAGVDEFIYRSDGLARATANGALLTADFQFCINTTMPAQNARTISIGSGSRISSKAVTQACP